MDWNNKIPVYSGPLPKRYNRYGEWMPLVNIGDLSLEEIDKKVESLAADHGDERVKGIIKYILATGFPVIEFIVKTKFKLPYPDVGIEHEGMNFHMRAIEVVGPDSNSQTNLQAYDGSLELSVDKHNIDIKKIIDGLDFIDILLHRLAFGANSKLEWFIKYHYVNNEGGIKNLKIEEYKTIIQYISEFKGGDGLILDEVISWYLIAKTADNVFIKFLNCYVALEALANSLVTGKMDISERYGFFKILEIKIDLKLYHKFNKFFWLFKYVQKEFNKLFAVSNYQKTLRALEAVFGVDDKNLKIFKKKFKRNNLYDLRNKLAHGSFKIIDQEDQRAIKDRVGDLDNLTRDFILKVLHGLGANEEYKKINPSLELSLMIADPRSCGITNNLNIFPNEDWRIKLEWLF